MSWDRFSEIYHWEMTFANPQQFEDEKFWYKLALETKGPVLDIAAGDGRITKPLLKTGFDITAIDLSEKMVNNLKKIKSNKLTVIQADMKNFELNKKFNLIICGYFSFQQLLTLEDQLLFLKTAKRHLKKNGILGLDIYPCVCEGYDISTRRLIYKKKFKNSFVEMYSSYNIDRFNEIKHWKDEYIFYDENNTEIDRFTNNISLKECSIDYMKLLIHKADLKIADIFGSFTKDSPSAKSQNIIYLIKK